MDPNQNPTNPVDPMGGGQPPAEPAPQATCVKCGGAAQGGVCTPCGQNEQNCPCGPAGGLPPGGEQSGGMGGQPAPAM